MYQYSKPTKTHSTKTASHVPAAPLSKHIVQRTPRRMKKDEDFAEFIMLKDKKAITEYCRRYQYAISFRRAGKYTIDKLEKGAAAKGHDILEKSIKEKSIRDESIFPYIPQELLGLVGWWDKSRTGIMSLKGLYLSRTGMKRLGIQEKNGSRAVSFNDLLLNAPNTNSSFSAQSLDITNEEKKQLETLHRLAKLIQQQSIFLYSDFITGDYDMHDLVYIEPGKSARSVVSHPDFAVVKGLNAAMNEGKYRPHSEYDRIQHGAQSSYSHYMLGHLHESPVLDLLKPDVPNEPIAMCLPNGYWYLLSSREDLEAIYSTYSININTIWPEGQSLTEREKTLTTLHGTRQT